jgi:benzodiazapine receptor
MTSYIPGLTLPSIMFTNPAASVLFPIALGTAVGFSVRRKSDQIIAQSILNRSTPFSHPLRTSAPPHHLLTLPATESQETYLALKQPPFRPPPWVYGPVWTILYGLMGYAAYRAVTTGLSPLQSPEIIQAAKQGATLYTIQLGLNIVWMPLFFRLKRPIEAAVNIVALTGAVSYLIYVWSKVDTVASWCLVPYLGWLTFATYVTLGVGHLNQWNIANKEVDFPPITKGKDTMYVDEKDS